MVRLRDQHEFHIRGVQRCPPADITSWWSRGKWITVRMERSFPLAGEEGKYAPRRYDAMAARRRASWA